MPKLLAITVFLTTTFAGHAQTAPSTRVMEARLRAIYAATDWKADPNKPAERVAYFQKLLATNRLSPDQQFVVYPQLAAETLRAGDPQASLDALTAWETLAHTQSPTLPPDLVHTLHEQRALADLRLGEQQNCLNMHGQHSCVFPLRAAAVHTKPKGAEGAVRELTWLLEHDPHAGSPQHDALSRWLLNIAYMQLGRYPRDVPPAYLLPESLFRSDADLGEFLDYATPAGVDLTSHAGGIAIEDFDGDGLLDIVTTSSGPLDPMHLFHNNGDGTFSDGTARAGLTGELGGLNLVLTDFDNDGHPDLLVLRGGWWGAFGNYPMSLLHNRGDGTFEDVTERAGLLHLGPSQTAAWADYDNDGWLDLFVGYESTKENPGSPTTELGRRGGNPQPARLFHNNHDGTFTDVSATVPLPQNLFIKGVAWGDLNNDGRPDLYVSVHDGTNHLLRNDGPANASSPDPAHWRFVDITAQAHVAPEPNTFATWFFDYNNDGWPDLYVNGYFADSMQDVGRFEAGEPFHAGLPHLYRNNHDGTFTDVAHDTHLDRAILAMGSNFGDLDNDGWLDIYLGTGEPSYQALLPNRMFRNNAGHTFEDVTTSGGFGHLQKGHAVAFADLENRGQEDIFEEMGGAFVGDPYPSALYRNPGHPGHAITLKLVGTRTNRAAYGARIEVITHEPAQPATPYVTTGGTHLGNAESVNALHVTEPSTNPGKSLGHTTTRHIFRTVGAVSSFGASPMTQHIGLGPATTIDELRIRWPADYAHEQIFRNIPADQTLRLTEGNATPEHLPTHPFTLGQTRLHPDALTHPMPTPMP